jgi:hypothetical protein
MKLIPNYSIEELIMQIIKFIKISKIKYNLKINIFLILIAIIGCISLLEERIQINAEIILENDSKIGNNNLSFYSTYISKYNKELQNDSKLESGLFKLMESARKVFPQGFKNTRDNANELDVLYPSTWKILKNSKPTSLNIVTFIAPSENNESPKAAIGIYSIDLPYSNISLLEFTNSSIKSLVKNYNISTIIPKILNGNSTMYTISYSIDFLGMKGMQAWTIKYDNAFIINYLADETLYKKYSSLLTPIIKSFKIY